MNREKDWLKQAKRDLDHAREDLRSGFYEWGCFSAQQVAKKAVKALYLHLHAEAWGHSVKKLLESLPDEINCSQEIITSGTALDKFYIPTRYPNGFDIGAPEEYYNENDCQEAIKHAESVIEFCENQLS